MVDFLLLTIWYNRVRVCSPVWSPTDWLFPAEGGLVPRERVRESLGRTVFHSRKSKKATLLNKEEKDVYMADEQQLQQERDLAYQIS